MDGRVRFIRGSSSICSSRTVIRKTVVALSMTIFLIPRLEAEESALSKTKDAVVEEAKRYGHDAKEIGTEPIRCKSDQWKRFIIGTAAVVAVYAADRELYDGVQRNRSQFSDQFAKTITPFGGRRAEYISLLMIGGGIWTHDDRLRDAGRDSLESEFLAGGIVTPLLKRSFGRSRPSQGGGAHSFHPFEAQRESFPSGHTTNAFAFATAVAGHYDDWRVPTLVYSIATGVAISRMNDRAHFPSDVVAGALIGHAIARSVVHRHKNSQTTWQLTPIINDHGVGLGIRFVTR